jgi:hypothetical protein
VGSPQHRQLPRVTANLFPRDPTTEEAGSAGSADSGSSVRRGGHHPNTAAATTAVIQMLWRGINPYDHGEVSGFAAQAGRIMVSSQRTVANAHVAAQQLQLKASESTSL